MNEFTIDISTTFQRKGECNYFFQRFKDGVIQFPDMPRITDKDSLSQFSVRDEGLNILFINVPIREWSYPNIMPLGQGYVGAVAYMDGHRINVLDLNAERKEPLKISDSEINSWIDSRITAKLNEVKPDVIAFGGIVTQYSRIKHATKLCKELLPDVPIILGGGIASSMPVFMLQRLEIDYSVQEEGEVTISELLFRIEKKIDMKGLKGVAYKEYHRNGSCEIVDNGLRPSIGKRETGLDSVPWPLRSAWPVESIYKHNPVGHLNWQSKWKDGAAVSDAYSVSMLASRGCPYAARACDYCYASYLGEAYRLRSPKEVADEMESIYNEYGATYIHFLDDLLMTDFRWSLALSEELINRKEKNGLDVQWGGTCRTNIVASDILRARKEGRPHMLERAYEAGMRQAGYGVETGSPTILKSIDKSGQTPEKIILAVEETQRIFGYADCSFIIGSPGETRKTVEETVDLCRQVGLKPEVFFFTTAYPATAFWDLALEKGLIRKAVTGEKGPADDDIIEQYLLKLGEQGEEVRTNFSDLEDEEVVELSWWAVNELGAQNTVRHPHTGDVEERSKAVVGASRADL